MRHSVLPVSLAAALTCWPNSATADGAYGRLDGDLGVQADVGAGSQNGHADAVGTLSLRYLQTAGAYNTWSLRPRDDEPLRWTTSFGVELRPLFLPRFFKDLQSGSATADLMIDSIGLRLGAVTSNDGPFSHGMGFEAGLGFGVPLTSSVAGSLAFDVGLGALGE